jgi:glyoxylase-like metal-dependent hydrolase (beta-lactamase superfamily II)
MRIHHLNCTTMCPLGGRLMDGRSDGLRGTLVCHCLLIEAPGGLVLVDTGFGLNDVRNPTSRLSRFFLGQMAPRLHEDSTAVRQVERLGFRRSDVRHIVVTHLDFDHAGGLDDFPDAKIHMLRLERDTAAVRPTMLDRMRYRPQQWASRARWKTYEMGRGEPWYGFQAVRELEGLPPEILLIPLIGHTLGHAGVAVDRGVDGWLLHAGDAYFWHGEMEPDQPWCTPGLTAYQAMMEKDRHARLENQRRLRALRRDHGEHVTIFCAHDPTEYERLGARVRPRPRPERGAPEFFNQPTI